MKTWEVFRFEIGYQGRRVSTWLFFVVLLGLVYRMATEGYTDNARSSGYVFNGPFPIASVTLLGSMMALLVPAALAGDAAARDVQTRMHPLFYSTPAGKTAYLGGRFLAAFALTAAILLAVPLGLLLAAYVPGVDAELMGPFRPTAYLGPYLFLALPNAFVATALLFALAALSRRAMASYGGSVLLFILSVFALQFVAVKLGRWTLAKLLDPFGLTLVSEMARTFTPAEKSTRLIALEGALLSNRLLWLGIALGVLALTYVRFRFAHPAAAGGRWGRGARRARAGVLDPLADAAPARPGGGAAALGAPIAVPRTARTFGSATRVRQMLTVAWESFRLIVTSWGGLGLAFLTVLIVLTGPMWMEHLGVPLFPTTARFTSFIGHSGEIVWMIVPLLTVHYAGELVWRERESGLDEIADAAPVPDWVALVGRCLGLCLVFVALQALMMAASVVVQARLGYDRFEIGLYARILFGLQLADLLLFALLAVAVHVVVDQKYAGHVVLLVVYALMQFGPSLGAGHALLVYGSDPGWAYSDMRGFGPFLAPFVWFKLYWAAWALLLAVAAKLLWVRGTEGGVRLRLHQARRRFTRPAAGAAAVAAGLILVLGGFVFYNTNVLNDHRTVEDGLARRAEYERRYGRYEGVPQPRLAGTRLHVEIHPRRREVEIQGSYHLVNAGAAAIESMHLATRPGVETGAVTFDRPAARVLADEALGHRIYRLLAPLQPGDSLRLGFRVRFAPRGFPSGEIDPAVAANGTFFRNHDWLPAIGYQPGREIAGAGARRLHRLPPRRAVRSLEDSAARHDMAGAEQIAFEAVIGTDAGQTAVAPGRLRRAWSEGGRRYFHYVTDVPIRNDVAFFSAAYAVREARWSPSTGRGRPVDIQVLHHPGHAWNAERMVHGVRASLDYHTRRFGPYPHGQIRLVEEPGEDISLHAFPVNISFREGFAIMRPELDPREIDFPFAVVAHEVAHQWWGNQLLPADVEGAPLLTESLAWYSALGVVEEAHGPEHLRRLLAMMREAYLSPRARASLPLLRATDRFIAYRKGPFAMYALREYVGAERVNAVLRRMIEAHGAGTPPLPTSLDLYRELRAVTPDSLHYLLTDLFEANTYWELSTEKAVAAPAATGAWRVTLDVAARKVTVDTAGVETEAPMNDLVEIGVFASAADGGRGEALYRRMHRVRPGRQRITVTVPRKPARAGIDPRSLLIDVKGDDNVVEVTGP
ncbi:MAG TPA: hypothetical protein VEX86_05360 [Longimicrobium sp.]|nr:hypothetical protein [Longimicrobium sp.]